MADESSDALNPAQRKLALEVEKLQIEVAALRKPAARWNLTSIVAVLTVAGTLIGAGFQYKLNQIKAEQTALELTRLESKHTEVQTLLASAIANLESTTKAQQEAKANLDQTLKQLADAEAAANQLVTDTEDRAQRSNPGE